MAEFFVRRRKSNAVLASNMNDVDRQRVASRIRHNKNHPCPGINSTTKVFVWETFEPYEPKIFRRLVTKKCREGEFSSYNDKTRRYDPIKDEWDCYHGWSSDTRDDDTMEEIAVYGEDPLFAGITSSSVLPPSNCAPQPKDTPQHSTDAPLSPHKTSLPSLPDPSSTSLPEASTSLHLEPQPAAQKDEPMAQEDESTHTLDGSDGSMVVDPPALSEPLASAPDDLMTSIQHPAQEELAASLHSREDDATVSDPPPATSNESFRVNGDDWQSALLLRFGFLGFNLRPQDFRFSQKAIDSDPETIKKLQRSYSAEGEQLPLSYYKPLIDFTDILITNRQRALQKPPAPPISLGGFWDMSVHSSRPLPLRTPLTEPTLSRFLRVRPLRCSKTGRVVYLVKMVQPNDLKFHLVVNHASTALECYRRNWRSTLDVIQHLTQVGKAFGTFVARLEGFTGPAISRTCHILGWRRKDYVFRPDDYFNYEALRSEFFETQAHARAGPQCGGIVWRLSEEVLGVASALEGPSPSAHVSGDILTSPTGPDFVNDRLTEEEMDMICGKYQVYTGSSNILCYELFLIPHLGQGLQTSQKSWWPLQSTFLKSSLWIGYWTQQCEDWYQAHKRKLEQGLVQPMGITEWKQFLRRSHDPPHVFEAIERAATDYFNHQQYYP
jgi:hypothetical protein